MDDDRNYLLEAYAILGGKSGLLPEVAHLRAVVEEKECQAIKCAVALDRLKTKVLNGEP